MEMETFVNDIVRSNVRSMYMRYLYEEKQNSRKYLTLEEQEDYIAQCATLDATSNIMLPIFKRLLSDIPYSELDEHGRKLLDNHVESYEKAMLKKSSPEEQQERIKAGQSGVVSPFLGSDESYYFGKVDSSEIRKTIGYGYMMSEYVDLCKQSFVNLLGASTMDEAVDKLSYQVVGIDNLPVNEQIALFDKIGICFSRHLTTAWHRALYDREYSKRLFPADADWLSNEKEYGELLAEVGIDMGEMPKTFVGEFYGYADATSNNDSKH